MAVPLYAADPPGAVVATEMEGLTVLFHRPSGATHILAPPAPQILAALAEGPADPALLLARIRRDWDVEDGKAILARLGELEQAGLVRRG